MPSSHSSARRPRRSTAGFSLVLAAAALSSACRNSSLGVTAAEIPTAVVQQSDFQIKVFTTGALRTMRSTSLSAPPIAGGALRITRLAHSGTPAHTGDVLLEFDPSQQQYSLAQNRSDLQQAEQEIIKAKADAAVQAAEDQTALLKARFVVRQAELEVSKNEIVSRIDAQKNLLALVEAKRALVQLETDTTSHLASNEAAFAVSTEKRNKARIAMQQAEQNIQNMHVKSPIDGLVVVHGNENSMGGMFFWGMTLPDYKVGDQANPGTVVAEVIDIGQLEISAQVSEAERANLKSGLSSEAQIDALPGEIFYGRLGTVASSSGQMFWDEDAQKKFEVTIRLDHSDPRLRPGFSTKLTILGEHLPQALSLPREAVFESNGKSRVFVKHGGGFVPQEVKVLAFSEGRAVVDGLTSGSLVALINPENRTPNKAKPEASSGPSLAPGAVSP